MRLAALMVNHGAGAFALAAARSLAREWIASGFEPSDLSLVVVDHPAGVDDTRWMQELASAGVQVVPTERNDGYAGGIERALALSVGEPDDLVAVLNPDIVFLPGSVAALVERLHANPMAGAVAPRAWIDEACTFQLPSPALPTAGGEILEALAARSRLAAGVAARRRSRLDWEAWTAEGSTPRAMLPGACLFLHRSVVESLDCLLDPRFPLYYEDADLCRRLAARGLELELVPGANVLHHGARSSGVGEAFENGPRQRWQRSRRTYLRRYAGPLGRLGVTLLDAWAARFPRPAKPLHGMKALPLSTDPPTVPLPVGGPWRLELSLTPTFGFALGGVATTGPWAFPRAAWDWLFPGRYYLRALDPAGRVRGVWTFAKHGPARVEPIWDVDREAALHAIGAGIVGLADVRDERSARSA